MDRQPCPYRVIDNVGAAFAMGSIAGGIGHFFNGVRIGARGQRFRSGLKLMSRGPVHGGQFATWGGLFSTYECILLKIRKKEDGKSSLMAGFCTGATIAWRGGYGVAIRQGIFGAIFLAMLESMSTKISQRQLTKSVTQRKLPSPPKYKTGGYMTPKQRIAEFDFIPKSVYFKGANIGKGNKGMRGLVDLNVNKKKFIKKKSIKDLNKEESSI